MGTRPFPIDLALIHPRHNPEGPRSPPHVYAAPQTQQTTWPTVPTMTPRRCPATRLRPSKKQSQTTTFQEAIADATPASRPTTFQEAGPLGSCPKQPLIAANGTTRPNQPTPLHVGAVIQSSTKNTTVEQNPTTNPSLPPTAPPSNHSAPAKLNFYWGYRCIPTKVTQSQSPTPTSAWPRRAQKSLPVLEEPPSHHHVSSLRYLEL